MTTIEELEPRIRSQVLYKLGKKYGGHPDLDDALQEAMIKAWRDLENGSYEFYHIVSRATQQAKAFIGGTATATGASRLSKAGTTHKASAWVNPSTNGGQRRKDYEEHPLIEDHVNVVVEDSFEDVLIGQLNFRYMIEAVPEQYARILVQSFLLDWWDKEIGLYHGYEDHPQPNGYRLKKQALNKLRKVLDA